jgi:hypothetical protein
VGNNPADEVGLVAVVVTFRSPDYHPPYGHRTRYFWPRAVPAEFDGWEEKEYDGQGRLVRAERKRPELYAGAYRESEVATIRYVALEGDREENPYERHYE